MITEPELRERDPFAAITGKYLSITSYRRDGTGVATPVWFVSDGERLLVQTGESSLKVKRIRREPRVSIAACSARGNILGEPVEAHAGIHPWDPEQLEPMFEQKYRLDLMFVRPVRAIQRLFHPGRSQERTVMLEITRG